ncbi:MAG: sigma-54 dependent transcriptional regulator [Bacteroidetes bacterium]|nr:sigma-54 dependent transcriptional regulator [Bacteroidota bacterium]
MGSKLLIVDDDELLNNSLNAVLTRSGYEVVSVLKGEDAIQQITDFQPDIVLLDLYLGTITGLDILQKLREDKNETPVILITAFSDVNSAVRAIKLGAEDFVLKPLDLEQLEILINKTLNRKSLERRYELLKDELQQKFGPYAIAGKSDKLKKVVHAAERLAYADTTVLVIGESGAGKELIARLIHEKSERSDGPFISINCGAIPKELAESELFGYEKGAFTGAMDKMRQGKFELANRGTILLDEVGELTHELQVKLLRVLETKRFYRLGGAKEVSVDVRIIAATNKNLKAAVEKGTFREDLYYRLNIAQLHVPPLRERVEDIALLANTFLDEFNRKFAKSIKGFTPEAIKAMERYSWPGNVRELKNAVERVALLETDTVVKPEHLSFLSYHPGFNSTKMLEGKSVVAVPNNGIKMDEIMREAIIQTLDLTAGNQIQAARILGLTRSRLRYRMQQLKIKYEPKRESSEGAHE